MNWADLVDVTTQAFTGNRYKLVEAAAAAIATAVLDAFSGADTVRVEVRKPSAPIEAIFDAGKLTLKMEEESGGTSLF